MSWQMERTPQLQITKLLQFLTIWPNYVSKYILLIVVTFILRVEYIGLQLTMLILILVLHI
jgi:hypothetical protein